MSEESILDGELKHYCRVTGSFKCEESSDEWMESYGTGDTCDEAQENLIEICKDACAREGQGDAILRSTDLECTCDRG